MPHEALTLDRLEAMVPEEAAAWFVAQRAEGLTTYEETLLTEWLAADQAHAIAFELAADAWKAFENSEDDEILSAMRTHALSTTEPRWTGWRPAAAAAAAVFLILASVLSFPVLVRSPDADGGQVIQYASARGEINPVELPDGSVMTLDTESAAQVRFGSDEREITLRRGRAYFDVEPESSRPFSVAAAQRRVVATGTRFEVDLASGGLRVTLLQGRVSIAPTRSGQQRFDLVPGQQFVEGAGESYIRKLPADSHAPPAWRNGLIELDDRPLSEAVAEINRYSREQIVVSDPDVAVMRVSGQFRAGDAERFARTVAEVHPVRIVRQGDTIELTRTR